MNWNGLYSDSAGFRRHRFVLRFSIRCSRQKIEFGIIQALALAKTHNGNAHIGNSVCAGLA